MIKVNIAGGRDFDDFNKLCQVCDEFLQDQNNIQIVSGAYKGADLLGERYAAERNHPIKQFLADCAGTEKVPGQNITMKWQPIH